MYSHNSVISCFTALVFLVSQSAAFAPLVGRVAVTQARTTSQTTTSSMAPVEFISYRSVASSLAMLDDEEEGPGLAMQIGIVLIGLLFVVTSALPYLDGGGRDLSIADSVVTQDASSSTKVERVVENKGDSLSRANIQEKLSGIPVFYLSDNQGSMGTTNIYISYTDAKVAADETRTVVKATSLDQVM
jgi:hypothetical protein